ncbi:MAG: ribosome small subunit-dependent GTPase A [Gammaproteobacteria bacterium]|uniref:ribosome small subunit-dependent GTPase A n=1 Tax=Azohydromonas sp. TaxID=1872666 RepID=UPI002C11C719|nr:ribosome small subunit-dependent GTPase A [Azohydromonas sp.]HMM84530.1 ribosome small subunit-dependent GTPase A [Azohydromonas sp.]
MSGCLSPTLQSIGLTPAMACRIEPLREVHPAARAARIVEVQRGGVRVHDGQAMHAARVAPGLQLALRADDDTLAVGDWVLVADDTRRDAWVVERVPPLNRLVRRGADGHGRQALVANVDAAMLACGLDQDFNLRRLDRYLAFVRMAGVGALVVLTKADLAADVDARVAEVRRRLRPSEDVVAVNALDAGSVTALQRWLGAGQTWVLLGSSGVGKSTLTNALAGLGGAAAQATGPVRADDSRGRHTTSARSLHRTPSGACLIDTPGLRTLRLDGDEQALRDAFDDVESLAARCRFRDCRHGDEPGCAVRGALGPERTSQYRKLLREVRRDHLSALERRAQVQRWKARSRAARAHLAAKGR